MTQSKDAFAALQHFYEKFPSLKDNDLYISGESYAGIYVPYLSWQVQQYNNKREIRGQSTIPLKGMMVGNGVTDFKLDVWPAYVPTVNGF